MIENRAKGVYYISTYSLRLTITSKVYSSLDLCGFHVGAELYIRFKTMGGGGGGGQK